MLLLGARVHDRLPAIRASLPVTIAGVALFFAGGLAAQQLGTWRLMTPDGHTDHIGSAAWSPDGRYVVTASWDRTARVWEAASGRQVQRLIGHADYVFSAVFSADGRHVVTASRDTTARVWEIASGREVHRLVGHSSPVLSATFSPDGRRIATASGDGTARIWDAATAREVQRLAGHSKGIVSVVFSTDGRHVATASGDSTARVWEVGSGREIQRFAGHADGVSSVAFSPDGRHLVTASHDSTARVWQVKSGAEVRRFTGHSDRVNCAAFSPDGRHVVSADYGEALVWDSATGRQVSVLGGGVDFVFISCAAFSPDGRALLTKGGETIRLWDLASGAELQRFVGRTDPVASASFSPDGRSVLTATEDSPAMIWDVHTGREVQKLGGLGAWAWKAGFSPDGRTVWTRRGNTWIDLWDVPSARQLHKLFVLGPIVDVVFSPDGRQLAVSSWRGAQGGTLTIIDVTSGREIHHVRDTAKHTSPSARYSRDGRQILIGSSTGTPRLLEVATWRELLKLPHPGHAGAFSADGRFILTTHDNTARIWQVESGREVRRFTGRAATINFAGFSPGDTHVLTGSVDGSVRLWDVATGSEARRFVGHTLRVNSAEFSPDGRHILTASADGTTRLWSASTGEELLRRIVVDTADWVVVAPDGRFDGSEGGMRRLHYVRGVQTVGLSAFFERFYTPGLASRVLVGVPYDGPDMRRGFGTPPAVRILSPQSGDTVSTTVTVAVAIDDQGGGAEDARLYHNGALVASTARGLGVAKDDCPAGATCFRLDLLPGVNTLEATAFSTARIEAERARVTVAVPGARPTATLHMLVVGINDYQNSRYSLNYGRADAKAFVDSLLAGAGAIYDDVVLDTLYDTAATGLAIKGAFRRAAARARPEDVFVFFYAGHGIAEQVGDSTRFYLVPSDVTQMSDAEQLAQRAVSNLQELFDAVPARKKIMLIDACQSGQALTAFAQRGAAEEQAIARLARASGVFVMSAAGSDQQASEVATLGHGVFTFAWLRALAAEATGPRERLVGALASEVERTIPDLSRQYRARPQYPIVFRNGQDFPLIVR